MRVIGRTLAGGVLAEIGYGEIATLVHLAEALVDYRSTEGAVTPSPQAPQPLAAAPLPDSAPATIRRKRVPRATGKTFAFPGGPAVKIAEKAPASGKRSARASTVTTKERPCEQCKMPYVPTGNAQKICPACKAARLEEIRRLAREQEE
jgi:hypothetical protein